jgi:hypothetical protein
MASALTVTPYFLLTLQSSPNLSNWKTVATNTPTTNGWAFTDTAPSTGNQRFYQAFVTR